MDMQHLLHPAGNVKFQRSWNVISRLFILGGFLQTAALGQDALLTFPQFVNGDYGGHANKSRIIMRNRGPEAVSGTLRFRNAQGADLGVPIDGKTLVNLSFDLAPYGNYELETDGTGGLVTGTVQASIPFAAADDVSGVLIYELLGNFVSVDDSPSQRRIQLFVSLKEDEKTGVALMNPDATQSAALKVTLLSSGGESLATRTLTLPPLHQVTQFVNESSLFATYFKDLPLPFSGSLRIEVSKGDGVCAVGLIQKKASGALLAVPPVGSGFFDVRGSQIVDGAGRPVQLRGINLGGWLVPEGYMLHIPGYGSPTSIRTQILDLIGPALTSQFYDDYRSNYVRQEDLVQLRNWGFDSVRLPLHYDLLYDQATDVFKESGFELINRTVDWCRRTGLYLVLDLHCAPGGQNNGNISDSDGQARLWTDSTNRDLTVKIWTELARRYAREKRIIGYDLLNEPVLPSGISNVALRTLYVTLAEAIRAVDANHLIFVEGGWWATDFSQLPPPFDSRMVYSFHKYWSATSEASISQYLSLRDQYRVPLWVGEFGENSNDWAYQTIDVLEKHQIGWAWWPQKKVESISSPVSAEIPASYQRVLDYWNNTASKPTPAQAQAGLFALTESLLLANCRIQRDVFPALLDQDRGRVPAPFRDHPIPGTIHAVDYDLGANGYAYYDRRSMRDQYENNDPWNWGWQYRNDGVDIEASSDPRGNGYNIGWIEDGEWVQFTLDTTSVGEYTVILRVASPNSGGRIDIVLDGSPSPISVSVPKTGGWQAWTSVTGPTVRLSEGAHRLRLVFARGGFNLSQVELAAAGG